MREVPQLHSFPTHSDFLCWLEQDTENVHRKYQKTPSTVASVREGIFPGCQATACLPLPCPSFRSTCCHTMSTQSPSVLVLLAAPWLLPAPQVVCVPPASRMENWGSCHGQEDRTGKGTDLAIPGLPSPSSSSGQVPEGPGLSDTSLPLIFKCYVFFLNLKCC